MAVLKRAIFLSLLSASPFVPTTLAAPVLDSVLGPLKDVIGTIGSGAGLIEGTLGAVKGVLGVEQR